MSSIPPPPPPPPPPGGLTPPPGYVPYGGWGGGLVGPVQKIGGLTKWLTILLYASLAVQVLSLVAQFAARSYAQDFVDGVLDSSGFDNKIGFFLTVALFSAAVGIGLIVVQCIWTFRIAKNLASLGRQPQSFKPGLTIVVTIFGGCTLGIANFFMWKEMWQGSDPDTPAGDPSWKSGPTGQIVVANLVLGLVTAVLNGAVSLGGAFGGGFNFNNSSKTVAERLTDRFGFVVIAGAVGIATAVVFIMLVRQLAERHMKAIQEA